MGMNLDKIRARLTTLQTQTKKQINTWKPESGETIIRIVPYKFNKDNPFIELLFHYNLNGKNYLSPASFGRPDPLKEFAEKIRQSGKKEDYKLSRELEPTMRTYVPIVVRGKEHEGVRFWGFGKQVYEQLLGFIADPDYGDISDPARGRDITVIFKTAKEAGKDFPATTIRVKPDRTMLVDSKEAFQAILDSQQDITEIYKEPTYDELKAVLSEWLNQPKTAEKAAPEAQAKTNTAPVVTPPTVSVAATPEELSAKFEELFK